MPSQTDCAPCFFDRWAFWCVRGKDGCRARHRLLSCAGRVRKVRACFFWRFCAGLVLGSRAARSRSGKQYRRPPPTTGQPSTACAGWLARAPISAATCLSLSSSIPPRPGLSPLGRDFRPYMLRRRRRGSWLRPLIASRASSLRRRCSPGAHGLFLPSLKAMRDLPCPPLPCLGRDALTHEARLDLFRRRSCGKPRQLCETESPERLRVRCSPRLTPPPCGQNLNAPPSSCSTQPPLPAGGWSCRGSGKPRGPPEKLPGERNSPCWWGRPGWARHGLDPPANRSGDTMAGPTNLLPPAGGYVMLVHPG